MDTKTRTYLEKLPFNKDQPIKDENALQAVKTIIDTRKEHGMYLELSNDYTKFRKLNVTF